MPNQRSCPKNKNELGKSVKVSTPRVMASANPRNNENVPSVTMRGGNRSRVIKAAFSPPASAPTPRVQSAATGIGRCASRQNLPNRMAHRPSNEPTDKSIPPARMIGVMASASSPISHECLRMSHELSYVPKFRPIALKKIHSATSTTSRMASCRNKFFFHVCCFAFIRGPEPFCCAILRQPPPAK